MSLGAHVFLAPTSKYGAHFQVVTQNTLQFQIVTQDTLRQFWTVHDRIKSF